MEKNLEDILALTPLQEGMLYHYLENPASDLYVEQLALELTGRVRRRDLETAWNFVVETNEMLRTLFCWEKVKKPVQTVLKEVKVEICRHDLSNRDASHRQELLEAIKTHDRARGFDLRRVPFRLTLCQVEEDRHVLIISHHHILFDGWSTGIILKEFFQAYHRLGGGNSLVRPPQKTKFKEFVKWIQKQDTREQEKYWNRYLGGFATPTVIPVKAKRGKEQGLKGFQAYSFGLDAEIRAGLDTLVKGHQVTLAAVLYTCWGILLQDYNNCDDVVFGTTVSGRTAKIKGIESMVGLFINTLPLRLSSPGTETLAGTLHRVDQALQERETHESTPLTDIKQYSEIDARQELFDSVWVIENYPLEKQLMEESGASGLTPQSHALVEGTHYDLAVGVMIGEELRLNWIYRREVLAEEQVRRMARGWVFILQQLIACPGKPVSAIERVDEAEKNRLLDEFNGRESRYPVDKTLAGLFAEQVARVPRQVALVFQGHHLTYRQLDERSRQLACLLGRRGLPAGAAVGLMAERSLEMIIAMLGILKAGRGYVPLNPQAPAARNEYILAECRVNLLLTTWRLFESADRVGGWAGERIFLDRENLVGLTCDEALPVPGRRPPAASLAYVIFTSGSTGKPKGVPIRHAQLSPLLHWGYRHLGLGPGLRTLQNLSYYFDWSVWEIFITLTSGAALYIAADAVLLDPGRCIGFIRAKDIGVLHITPTQFQAAANEAIRSGQLLAPLKYLCIGAEKLTYDLVRRSYAVVSPGCRIYNMYGPTEATIMAAVLEIHRGRDEFYRSLASVPIGVPIANFTLLVLDRNWNLTPIGLVGSLVIAGDGLSDGYLNNPELTAEKFCLRRPGGRFLKKLPPWTPRKNFLLDHSPTYQTGDRVRWLAEGSIEFIGRVDQQVKIRGFRIEPGEVEKELFRHPAVKDAVVVAREGGDGETALCAYIVSGDDTAWGERSYVNVLKEFLALTLPTYMIPASIVKIERIPLNPNKKIDLKALPAPDRGEAGPVTALPRNPLEEKLLKIWQEVLKIDRIGIDEDFFDLGGHSLKVLDLVNALQRELGVKLGIHEVFEFPTIAELLHRIEKGVPVRCLAIPRWEEREYDELSYNQKRLWLLCRQEPGSPAFNLSGSIALPGRVEEGLIRRVLEQLAERHESFRTYFKKVKGNPVQLILPGPRVDLQTADLSGLPVEQRSRTRARLMEKERSTPFELETPPLARALLIKGGPGEFDLVLTMHHLITDGWSVQILEREFHLLYEAAKRGRENPLRPQAIRYRDWVYWHNRLVENPDRLQGARAFWENQLHGELPRLNLPYDYPGAPLASKASSGYRTVLPAGLTQRLRELAKIHKASLFMVLLGGFFRLLSRLCGQEDILVGIPAAARQHDDLKNITGLFVNTLVLRNKVTPGESFALLLARVQANTLQALEYQSYPLELICSRYKIRYPELSVFFNMLTFGEINRQELRDHESYPVGAVQEAKFHLVCYLTEYRDAVEINTHYLNELFTAETTAKILQKYTKLLGTISNEKF